MIVLDRQQSDASIALDLLRASAAQVVCIGHSVAIFVFDGPWPAHVVAPQSLAVGLFFLLSGFLIGHTLQRRAGNDYGYGDYVVERTARIYTGWVPALLFVAAVDGTLILMGRYEFHDAYSVSAFIGNLFMLQMYGGQYHSWFGVPTAPLFGSAGPFWTLAVEFHIYLFVGAVYFIMRGGRSRVLIVAAVIFCAAPLRYLFGDVEPGVGTGLFSVWIAGFAIALSTRTLPPLFVSAGLLVWSLTWFALAGFRYGTEYTIGAYALMTAAFFGYVTLAARIHWLEKTTAAVVIRFAADYSYTLYLVHFTTLYAMSQLTADRGIFPAVVGIVLSNLVAAGLALGTEMRHRQLAHWLRRQLRRRFAANPS